MSSEVKREICLYPINVSACLRCPVLSNGLCLLAQLEQKLGRVPTTIDVNEAGIDHAFIPSLFCPNQYTSSKNTRIF